MYDEYTLPSQYFEFKSVWENVNVKNHLVDLLIERIRLIEQRLPQKSSEEISLSVKTSKVVGLENEKLLTKTRLKENCQIFHM